MVETTGIGNATIPSWKARIWPVRMPRWMIEKQYSASSLRAPQLLKTVHTVKTKRMATVTASQIHP